MCIRDSYWTFSDIFEEGGMPYKPFHGGFGLLNLHVIPKASYRAFQLLNKLGDERYVRAGAQEMCIRDRCKTDTGRYAVAWMLNVEKEWDWGGPLVRKDWLEDCGLDLSLIHIFTAPLRADHVR